MLTLLDGLWTGVALNHSVQSVQASVHRQRANHKLHEHNHAHEQSESERRVD